MSTPWESRRDPSSSEPGYGSTPGTPGSGPQDGPAPYSPPTPHEAPDSSGLAPYSDPYQSDPYSSEPYSSSAYGPSPYGPAPYDSGSHGPGGYGQPYGQAPYGQSPYGQNPYGQNPYGQNPYGQAPYGQNPYGQGYPPARPTSGLAIAALVCGIVGFFTAGLASIPAVICGHMAWRETSSGTHSGHGMAIAGLVLGYLQILGWALFWLFVIGSVASV